MREVKPLQYDCVNLIDAEEAEMLPCGREIILTATPGIARPLLRVINHYGGLDYGVL